MNAVIIIISICSLFVVLVQTLPKYYDVSIGKCDGSFSSNIGRSLFDKSAPEFIIELRNSSNFHCRWVCARDLINCWMIEYFEANSCRLFSNISYVTAQKPLVVDIWLCEDKVCSNIKDRCAGYWVGYASFKISSEANFPLDRVNNIPFYECQRLCEDRSMCGSVNFRCLPNTENKCTYAIGNCTLLYGFAPLLDSVTLPRPFDDAISWRCCTDRRYYFQDSDCQERIVKKNKEVIQGQWKFKEKYDTNLKLDYLYYSHFETLDSKVCVEVCSNNPFCVQPIYVKGSIPLCYLALDSEIGNEKEIKYLGEKVAGSEYEIWEWKDYSCNDKKSQTKFEKYVSCLCFQRNTEIRINNIECTQFNNIFLNRTLNLYAAADFNETLELSDGMKTFKVRNNDLNKLSQCELFKCDLYNALVYEPHTEPRIILRHEWFAKPSRQQRNNLLQPIGLVIILNTYKPNGRCFSPVTCSSFVRDFQHFQVKSLGFDDIGYNFLIGEDGHVYEGRGWFYVGAHTGGYNTKSIGIAFIGWFETVYPNKVSLVALRNLISYGIAKGYLTRNLVIKNNRNLRPTEIPGKVLKNIIDDWSVANITKMDICTDTKVNINELLTYTMSVFVCLSVMLSLYFGISYGNHKRKCCSQTMARINLIMSKPECVNDSISMNYPLNINIKKDWIYLCENIDGGSKCKCSSEIGTLFTYCMTSTNKSFATRLNTLLQTSTCSRHNSIFLISSRSSLESKHLFIFHLKEENVPLTEKLFERIKSKESCVCKEFILSQYPPRTHQELIRNYTSFSDDIIDVALEETFYETVNERFQKLYINKCYSKIHYNSNVNFVDLS